VKVTEIVQLAAGATVEPQVLVSAKSPVAVIVVTPSAAVPVFESVIAWLALVLPSA
jgi:hypothetical protein